MSCSARGHLLPERILARRAYVTWEANGVPLPSPLFQIILLEGNSLPRILFTVYFATVCILNVTQSKGWVNKRTASKEGVPPHQSLEESNRDKSKVKASYSLSL